MSNHNFKKDINKKHFYTITCEGVGKKAKYADLFLFYEKIEEVLNKFPDEPDEVLEKIKNILKVLYSLFWKRDYFEIILKNVVFIEKKAEELEKLSSNKIKGFVDFTKVKDKRIKNLNNLRIKIRELESLFWTLAKEIINKIGDDGRLLVIPHFLNISSKYIFYYMINNFDFEYYNARDKIEKLDITQYDKELFEKYKKTYLEKKIKDYL